MLGMITEKKKKCGLRSECRRESDQKYWNSLFAADWEVFVIREDVKTGQFVGTTVCCESALSLPPTNAAVYA